MPTPETLVNIANAIGVVVLAVPAFSLNFRKKTLARISDIIARRAQRADASVLDDVANELEDTAKARANRWRRVDEVCLFAGYLLVLGASAARIFV